MRQNTADIVQLLLIKKFRDAGLLLPARAEPGALAIKRILIGFDLDLTCY